MRTISALIGLTLLLLFSFGGCGGRPNAVSVTLIDMADKTPHFSYLNLDRSPDRKASMINQLDLAKVSYDRFAAIEGKDQNTTDLVTKGLYDEDRAKNSPLNAGEIGVYLSNIKFLEERSKVDDGKIHFLLEDDTIIPIDVRAEIATAFKTVPEDWDLLYLGCYLDILYDPYKGAIVQSPYNQDPRLQQVCPLEKMAEVIGSPWLKMGSSCTAGAYAYAVRYQSINAVLSFLKPMRFPVDEALRQGYGDNKQFKAYCLNPNLIRTRYSLPSTIR